MSDSNPDNTQVVEGPMTLEQTREHDLREAGKAILEAVSANPAAFDDTRFSFFDDKSKEVGYGHYVGKIEKTRNPDNEDDVYRSVTLTSLRENQIELYIENTGYKPESAPDGVKEIDLNSQTDLTAVWSLDGKEPKLQKIKISIQDDYDTDPDCVVSFNPETGQADKVSLDKGLLQGVAQSMGLGNEMAEVKTERGLYVLSQEIFEGLGNHEKKWGDFVQAVDAIVGSEFAKGIDINATVKTNLESPGNTKPRYAFIPKLVYQN